MAVMVFVFPEPGGTAVLLVCYDLSPDLSQFTPGSM